jgi:quercetin dioxygenase-like cupin family protein
MQSATMCCAAAAWLAFAGIAPAQEMTPIPAPQEDAIKRTPLQRFDVGGSGYETALVRADFAPDTRSGRHTHPGPVTGYVVYGSLEVLIDGKAPLLVRAGESFVIPANAVHEERTTAAGAKVIGVFLVPDGQPVVAPAG